MNYWLLCLPRADMEHCIKIGTFGLNRKHLLGKVAEGDKVVCCAGKGDWKLISVGTVSSGYYVDDTKVFLREGLFPDRIDFAAHMLTPSEEVDLMSIIEDLSFVTNVAFWAVYFRSAIVQMTRKDWDLIASKIPRSNSTALG